MPWLEHGLAGLRADEPQRGRFRIFKSHLKLQQARAMLDACPDALYITCMRAPHDVSLSFFQHMRGVWARRCNGGDPAPFGAAYDPSMFALADLPGGYEANLLDWIALADRPNVLIVWYEEMLCDPLATLRRLASFVGVETTPELEASALKSTSYEAMAAKPAFTNVFPGGGTYGRGRATLLADAIAAIDARWERIRQKTGCANYEALYTAMHAGAPFPL